jgi:hypothetical protein
MDLPGEDTATDRKEEVRGESRAFVLLETARLRAETLIGRFGHSDHFSAIQREIGLAGYVTCSSFDPEHRQACLALAITRLADDGSLRGTRLNVGRTLATMFSETIAASDALAGELADREVDEAHRDRLHQVHAHVMSACELLDERLTVLELEGAGVEGR